MATVKGEVKGGQVEQFELLLAIIDDLVRVHPTWSGFELLEPRRGSTSTTTKIKMFLQIMLSYLCWESYVGKTRVLFLVTGKD